MNGIDDLVDKVLAAIDQSTPPRLRAMTSQVIPSPPAGPYHRAMMNSTHPTPLHYVLPTMLVLVGLIHMLPVSGVLGSVQLAKLYGIAFTEPNAAILMRHRALLLGLLGVFLIFAAFRPALQAAALGAGFVSVASFLWLAWSVGGYNGQVGRVCVADGVALLCLVVGAVAWIGCQNFRSN